ncbi:Phosphatidylinositol-3-phosphatase SAC1 [Saxophila tyrrhenica]|uniref:Phosphatidylinositol-3-phosphatase SAC1 n=1 Tax=Saxophila tyrrhenica TaxID=1690608 RepID=A0AAV9P4T8_9PEZI|nr:Phosphatidylinositol-3-phosphatase SAC1 [Saxophila tyrrhenica]
MQSPLDSNSDIQRSVEAMLEEEELKHKARAAGNVKKEPREFESYGKLFDQTKDFVPLEDSSSSDPRSDGRDRGGRQGSHNKNRYSTEREENDERRSRRSRDLADDDDVKGNVKDGSEKGSANGSVRSRNRSRSPGRYDRRDPANYRQRDRLDSYQPSGGRREREETDSYRPGSSGGRSRYRDDYRDHPRDRDRRDRDRYHSDRDNRRPSHSHSHGSKRAPEPTDDEKDRRTVFCQQLASSLKEHQFHEFFEQVGQVITAQIVRDRISNRSKGVGYVEFKEEESVPKAIALTGQKLNRVPIIVQLTEAEKNRQAKTTEGTATQSNGVPFHRLYVGNIHFSITEGDLRDVFEPFGDLEFVQLQKEEQGRSKGYGFVQFVDPTKAKEALEHMNGFEVAGRPIRVGLGNDKFTPESTQSLLQRFGAQAPQQGSQFSGMGGRGAHAGGTANFDRASGKEAQEKTGGASALDDSDVAGVSFSNYSRDSLMRKLARTDEPEQKIAVKAPPKKAPVEQTTKTRCVLIKNMFDQAEEEASNPGGWQKELTDDVKEECDKKYGVVVHIAVSPNSDEGEVYVKFDRMEGGENAIRGLNGRRFAGRVLSAQYVVDHIYNMMFPAASNK